MPNTAWHPLDAHSKFTLSSGNLVATAAAVTGDHAVVVADGQTSGKYYVEITIAGASITGNTGIGVQTASPSYAAMGSNATSSSIVFASGNIWYSGANSGFTLGAIATGNVICIALDLTNNKVWFRKGAGNWDGNATHNPATNVGGISIASLVVAGRPWYLAAIATSVTLTFTLNSGDTTFSQAVPSGFTSGWPSVGATPNGNTFNPASASSILTISNGGLTASTVGNATSSQWVKCYGGASTGKYYWEYYVNDLGAGVTTGRGIANANTLTNNFYVNATDGALYYSNAINGSIWVHTTTVVASTSSLVGPAGIVSCVAADLGAQLIWFRASAGNWNNSGTANPATGVGGISISALGAGVLYPAVAGIINTPWQVSINTTAYPKIPPPAGFTVGPPLGVPPAVTQRQYAVTIIG